MWLLDKIKSWVRSAWSGVKNFLWFWDTYQEASTETQAKEDNKQTLNEQIANWNIYNKTTNTNTNTDNNTAWNYKSAILDVRDSIWQAGKPINEQEIDTRVNQIQQNTPEADKEKELTIKDLFTSRAWEAWTKLWSDALKVPEKLTWWIAKKTGQLSDFVSDAIDSRRATTEYNENEKLVAVGYNKDNKNVQYLDLNESRWLFDNDWWTRMWTRDMYEKYLSEWMDVSDNPDATQEQKDQALMDFYDKAKWLFRIREDDYYTNWLFQDWALWKRRYEMYTPEELEQLSKTWDREWRYTPTFDEFIEFVWTDYANKIKKQEINAKRWLNKADDQPEDVELIELWWDFQSNWKSNLMKIATQNFDDYFAPARTVNGNAGTEMELYAYWIFNDRLDALYTRAAPVYNAEREILKRDKSTWTVWDQFVIDTANRFREMEKAYANWMNEWIRQQALYWTSKDGHMVRMLDVFEGWESLADVLNKEAIEISWQKWNPHLSILDITGRMANEAMYSYTKDHNSWFWAPLKNVWSDVELLFEPVGRTLWEWWQRLFWLTLDTLNSLVTWHDGKFNDYQDQDFSVWFMIETDDGNFTRTVKKYAVDIAEVAPEAIWNIAPDIAFAMMTWPGWLTTLARHAKDLNKVYKLAKEAKWASFLRKTWAVIAQNPAKAAGSLWYDWNKARAVLWAIKSSKKVDQTVKTWAELLDRAITQLGIWQMMDWQWSAYDTEPYSNASFFMSLIWSTAFDVFPELFRWLTWKWWFNTLIWDWKWGNIWTLARYIDSSDEAAENVARALWKRAQDIWVEDLKAYARNFWAVESAAKQVYGQLSDAEKAAIGKMTKDLTWNFISQAYWSNSNIGKNIRLILANWSTNIADVYKYLGKIPWDVAIWPYISQIKLKNWTNVNVLWTWEKWMYNPKLDTAFSWNFTTKLKDWFTDGDLNKLSKLDEFSDMEKNKDKYFYKVSDSNWDRYYLNEEWIKKLWMKAENLTLEAIWVSIARAEDVKWIFKEKMKNLANKNIEDTTVDAIADTWAYDEVVYKVKEVLWC